MPQLKKRLKLEEGTIVIDTTAEALMVEEETPPVPHGVETCRNAPAAIAVAVVTLLAPLIPIAVAGSRAGRVGFVALTDA